MKEIFIRSPFNYDMNKASMESATPTGYDENGEPTHPDNVSKVVQSEKDNSDINVIVKRFGIGATMPDPNRKLPEYGDYTGVNDFKSAMDAIKQAQSTFNELPADVRAFFENDPQKFLDFASDPDNIDKLREMGLARQLTPEEIDERDAALKAASKAQDPESEVFDDEHGIDDEGTPSRQKAVRGSESVSQRSAPDARTRK